jgi:hypothetical protein
MVPRLRARLGLAHTAGSCDLTAAVGDIASVSLCLPTLRADDFCNGLMRFVDAPSLVFYAQRIGMNAIENDMKMIVLSVAVQCKNGQMIAAHTEMPFQNFYGFIALRLRRLLAFLPTQQPMINGIFTASRLYCKSNHFGALPLLRVRIEVSVSANVLRLLCVRASIGLDVVEQAANARGLLDCVFGLAMYLTIMVGDSFDSSVYCADCRDALVYHFDVLGELVNCALLQSSQPAQLANHHQVSCRVNRLAKSALANQLAYAHPGKVGLLDKLLTLCCRQPHFES